MNLSISMQKVFMVSLIGTIVLIISLQIIGRNLVTPLSPMGIVSFEFSSNMQNADSIMSSWNETGKISAALNLGLDYLFILMYTTTLLSGCIVLTKCASYEKGKTIKYLSKVMIISSVVAALLDVIENFALIRILTGNGSDNLAALAMYCAIPKFILVGLVILFIISLWSVRKLFNKTV